MREGLVYPRGEELLCSASAVRQEWEACYVEKQA